MLQKIIYSFLLIVFFYSPQAQTIKKTPKTDHKYKWIVGIGLGTMYMRSDVTPGKLLLSKSINLYKPIAKWFGVKLNFTNGNIIGQNYIASQNFGKNTALSDKYSFPIRKAGGQLISGYISNGTFVQTSKTDIVYYNYKTKVNAINTSAEFTIPIPYSNPRFGIHFSIGVGFLNYNTKTDALDNNGKNYATLYNDIYNSTLNTNTLNNKKEILTKLKNGRDHTYETEAEQVGKSTNFYAFRGLGISYKFKKRYIIKIERTDNFIKTDLLDGQRWQEIAYGDAVLTREFDKVIGYNLNFSYCFKKLIFQ